MIIAQEKKKSNIAEYILYMWQVEDMIRACKFDIELIEKTIIRQMKLDPLQNEETKIWYADLIEKMHKEKITETGHFSFVNNIIEQLNTFHLNQLKNPNEIKHSEVYKWAKENIEALQSKINSKQNNDVLTAFTGLYGILVLRLKRKEISQETAQAMQTISNFIAYLSASFMKSNKIS